MADEVDEHLDAKEGDVAWEIREFVRDRWNEDEWETAWVRLVLSSDSRFRKSN